MVHYSIFKTTMLENLALLFGASKFLLLLLIPLRIHDREHLVMIPRLDKRRIPLRRHFKSSDFVALPVDVLAGFVVELAEALADEDEEAAVAEALEERVGLESLLMDAHNDCDAQSRGQLFYEI